MLSASQQSRRLVPQWRRFSSALTSSELSMPLGSREKAAARPFEPDLVERIQRFRIDPCLVSAADLVESAVVLGHESEAVAAARSVLRSVNAVPLVRAQAAGLLRRCGDPDEVAADPETGLVRPSKWRERARLNPGDAVPWVELALTQMCNGHLDNARQSMNVALHLAPNNRHVLRAAARFFFQLREFDRAHDLFRGSDATRGDPWLMAAEIALSFFAERRPVSWKQGLALVESNALVPAQTTELAGALGTQILVDGGGRMGRKLMRQSQLAPTVNAVAQAEWVSLNLGDNVLEPAVFRVASRAWEALALHAFFMEGNFGKSLECAKLWVQDELYNPMAYAFTAATANFMEDCDSALGWSKAGLAIAKDFEPLLNTMAFAQASSGDLDGAEAHLAKIRDADDNNDALIAVANRGLVAMRRGDTATGRALYERAVKGFRKKDSRDLEASALAYFAAELTRAGLVGEAAKRIEEAKSLNRTSIKKYVRVVIERVEHMLEAARRGDAPPPAPSDA